MLSELEKVLKVAQDVLKRVSDEEGLKVEQGVQMRPKGIYLRWKIGNGR